MYGVATFYYQMCTFFDQRTINYHRGKYLGLLFENVPARFRRAPHERVVSHGRVSPPVLARSHSVARTPVQHVVKYLSSTCQVPPTSAQAPPKPCRPQPCPVHPTRTHTHIHTHTHTQRSLHAGCLSVLPCLSVFPLAPEMHTNPMGR